MIDNEIKNLGRLIKYHRQQQGLKQDDLAVGICTSSYLSRIENGVVVAEQTVYDMLLAHLGIDLVHEKENVEIRRSLFEKVYAKLLSNDIVTEDELTKLESFQTENFQHEIDVLARLVYSRYLLSNDMLNEARELLLKLEPFITWHRLIRGCFAFKVCYCVISNCHASDICYLRLFYI